MEFLSSEEVFIFFKGGEIHLKTSIPAAAAYMN